MSGDLSFLEPCGGKIRLFPLPSLVLFPHVVQPLHIFEPRYRQMTAEALADNRLIAMALLRPGWESDYQGCPPIYPVACLGKITEEQRLPDGRYQLLLQGRARVRVEEELCTGAPFRTARARLLHDSGIPSAQTERRLRQKLADRIPAWFAADGGPLVRQFQKLLKAGLPLGALCDVLSFTLPFEVQLKQRLLQETEVEQRARLLLRCLNQRPSECKVAGNQEQRSFPPAFSKN